MIYGPEAFADEFAVSRETLAKLSRYADLLVEWQQMMNLVGASTLGDLWQRHFRDSAQLAALGRAAPTPVWLDIGAGGGFPGLVLAALGAGEVHLVESIGKKCRFLAAVADELDLRNAIVHHARVEALPAFRADVITARACANLAQLFDWGVRFATDATRWILPKGATVEDELAAARRTYRFDAELVQSRTDPRGRIVVARGVRRK